MRKILEVLRLKFEGGHSDRVIAASVDVGHTSVGDYVLRAKAAGLSWPLPAGMDDAQLDKLLFPPPAPKNVRRTTPEFGRIYAELRRPNVTLSLLWTEYKEQHPDGYQLSQYCELYNRWAGKLRLSMRQHHRAGEKMFVDFSGGTLDVINPLTGEVKAAKLFVAVMGASSYTFVSAVFSEDLPSWLGCHVKAFEFFGGVPAIVVPDNLKSGVQSPHLYEPEINRSYTDLATHYGTCVIPARVRKPKDKAKVEVGVQVAQRWILAALRDRTFHSLAELNEAIAPLLLKLNSRLMREIGRSRLELFAQIDAPTLQPLPANSYEFAQWKKGKIHPDYHMQFDDHFYSTPYQVRGQEAWARGTERLVEILVNNLRVASHERSYVKWAYSTLDAHMAPAHQRQADHTIPRVMAWAGSIGPSALALVEVVMSRKKHPEQGVKTCFGILGFSKTFGPQRLENACVRALRFKTFTYKSIQSILQSRLDEQAEPQARALPRHGNIRGGDYFH